MVGILQSIIVKSCHLVRPAGIEMLFLISCFIIFLLPLLFTFFVTFWGDGSDESGVIKTHLNQDLC